MYVRGNFDLFFINCLLSFLNPHRNGNPITQLICLTIEDVCCSCGERFGFQEYLSLVPVLTVVEWGILTVNRYQRIISQANIWYTSSSGGPRTIANIWYTAPGLLLSQLSSMFCHQDIKEDIFSIWFFSKRVSIQMYIALGLTLMFVAKVFRWTTKLSYAWIARIFDYQPNLG